MIKNTNYIKKVVIKATLISIAITIVLTLKDYFSFSEVVFYRELRHATAMNLLYSFVLTSANILYFDYINDKVNWKQYCRIRFIVSSVGSSIVTIIGVFILCFVKNVLFGGLNIQQFLDGQTFENYFVSLIITFIVSTSFYAIHNYKSNQETKVKEQKIIAGTANAQFESLKNQIDPHFLFNSLNVLSALIEENPESAQKFTTSLSKIYRYVLEQKDKELVPLEEELDFAKTYMKLLSMRFENSLFYEIDVKIDFSEARVVPLSLQLLLENCIKHNIVSEQKPLQIKIFVENDYLIIENNLQKKPVFQERQGVGLQNIINRYSLITQRKVLIEENKLTYSVRIPILTKQIKSMQTIANSKEQTAYLKAKQRVEELKGFYGNLISFCTVIPILVIINLVFSPQFQWFWFSLIGWGFGLLMHGLKVFGYTSNWEERKIQELLNKENRQNWN